MAKFVCPNCGNDGKDLIDSIFNPMREPPERIKAMQGKIGFGRKHK